MFTISRWANLCERLGANSECKHVFESLKQAYGQSHRFYHTAQHISECLAHYDSVAELIDNPNELEMAIWMHDVIYKILSRNNEEHSAAYAEAIMRNADISNASIALVKNLILHTDHNTIPSSSDAMFIVDIDLCILGQSEARYAEYEKAVRSEYKQIPLFFYNQKRAELLNQFLSKQHIYLTDYFRSRYESTARANLEQSIKNLNQPMSTNNQG